MLIKIVLCLLNNYIVGFFFLVNCVIRILVSLLFLLFFTDVVNNEENKLNVKLINDLCSDVDEIKYC